MEAFLRDQMQFSGGPHLIVDDQEIWLFNPLSKPGIYSPTWNKVAISIMMVGDYDSEDFDPHVRDNTVKAIAILDTALQLEPSSLKFRKEDPRTLHRSSPGHNV